MRQRLRMPTFFVARKAQPANLIVIGLLVTLLARTNSLSQSNSSLGGDGGDSAERNLVASIESEEKKGVSVLYTQAFVDTANQKTFYSGSIYAAINAITTVRLKSLVAPRSYFSTWSCGQFELAAI